MSETETFGYTLIPLIPSGGAAEKDANDLDCNFHLQEIVPLRSVLPCSMFEAPLSIHTLPTELITQVLDALDLRSLLRCKQVCRLFHDLIDAAAVLQYKTELAVAGMEDGPSSDLSTVDRLTKLKAYQDAWSCLRFDSQKIVPMLRGEVWELYGGVLAQARGPKILNFRQLPSVIRGIDEREWTTELGFIIRDFGMDPSQELLVVIETPRANSDNVFLVHLRVISTGQPHPAAPNPAMLSHYPDGDNFTYAIQVSTDFLGVLFISSDEHQSELVVWNWKAGTLVLWLCGEDLGTFAFLSDRHILLGITHRPDLDGEINGPAPEPVLTVIDYLQVSNEKVDLEDARFVCAFHFPRLCPMAMPLSVSIRSDPAPSWKPHPGHHVPFYTAREDRLFVTTFWVADDTNIRTYLLFVPSSTLLSHIGKLEPTAANIQLPWEAWGPESTRMVPAPAGHSAVWVCYVFGMKFVSPKRWGMVKGVQIHDFNQLALRRQQVQGDDPGSPEEQRHNDVTTIERGMVFEEDVTTSLPYRTRIFFPPTDEGEDFDAVMLSEDTLITVTSQPRSRKYRMLTL